MGSVFPSSADKKTWNRSQRSVSAPSRVDGRHLRHSLDEVCALRSHRGGCRHAHRFGHVHSAQHGIVAQLWPRHGQSKLAFVHRDRSASTLRRNAGLRQRFFAGVSPRDARDSREQSRSPTWYRAPQRSEVQELEFSLVDALNRRHLQGRSDDSQFAARIKSYETAFHMQTAGPEAFDLQQEDDKTLAMYGLKRGDNTKLCLAVSLWRGDWPNAACGLLN